MDAPLTPELLLLGYQSGVFPMSEGRDDPDIFWVDPKQRGVFPLGGFHISRSLARQIRKGGFEARFNTDFAQVLAHCAAREDTWISGRIERIYQALHDAGHAHSQEIWQDGELIGGVYGVVLGGAFFGESMFSARTGGSKLALAYLIHRLNAAGFTLFDTQFLTPHLASLGAIEISRKAYRARLKKALGVQTDVRAPVIPNAPQLIEDMTENSTQRPPRST